MEFCISGDQLALVDSHTEVSEEMIGSEPIVVIRRDNERQIHFTQNMSILFSSGAIQVLAAVITGVMVLCSLIITVIYMYFKWWVCITGHQHRF